MHKNATLGLFIRKALLLILGLYSLFFIAGSIASPVLARLGFYDLSAKMFFLFMGSCHQQPHLSFWILGYPLALCCRCFGTYLGTFVTSIFLLFKNPRINIKIFLLFALLVIIDITLNYVFQINTGKIIRFLTGCIMGFLITVSIYYILYRKMKRRKIHD